MNAVFLELMRKILASISILCLLFISIHGLNAQNTRIERYDPMMFNVKLTHLKNTLLDVRTPQEFSKGHLKGALLIDWETKTFKQKVDSLPKYMPIFVYCQGGYRSDQSVEVLTQCGFTTIILLEGGFDAWIEAGLPAILGNKEKDSFTVPQ